VITLAANSSLILSCTKKNIKQNTKQNSKSFFKFNLSSEIKSTDPLLSRGSEKRYMTYNIHRGLYYYNKEDDLTPHGAKSCISKNNYTTWICKLKKLKYHDSNLITSEDYINTFNLIKEKKEVGLESVKNIKDVFSKDTYTLNFVLKKPNPNFLHKLTNLNLVPRQKESYLSKKHKTNSYSGPYFIKDVTTSRVLLLPNSNFKTGRKIKRPKVMGLFIDSPTTALNLYEKNEIDFLRYLETSYFKAYKNNGAFLSKNYKLDGVFLNPKLSLEFRKFLAHSLKYQDLKKVFSSKSLPGCVELSNKNFNFTNPICYKYKKGITFKKRKDSQSTIKIHIPNIGRNDHIRLSEWLKGQWEQNSDVNFVIEQVEIKTYYQKANQNKYDIYRRSLPLEELHCLHAKNKILETSEFKATGLSTALSCSDFYISALNEYLWIPLGLVHNVHINAKKFDGYYINSLDHFGLENLKRIMDDE